MHELRVVGKRLREFADEALRDKILATTPSGQADERPVVPHSTATTRTLPPWWRACRLRHLVPGPRPLCMYSFGASVCKQRRWPEQHARGSLVSDLTVKAWRSQSSPMRFSRLCGACDNLTGRLGMLSHGGDARLPGL